MYIQYSNLWKLLAEKELTKSDLMELTGLSSRVIAKLAKNEIVTTDTIGKICTALNCNVCDIMECSAESNLSLYQFSRTFGKITLDELNVRKLEFVRNEQKFGIYVTKKSATKAVQIDCGADNTVYWTRYYLGGGHGRPAPERIPLVKPDKAADEICIVVIKGKPGSMVGLDDGIWVSAKNGKLRNSNQIFVMSESAFKLFDYNELQEMEK